MDRTCQQLDEDSDGERYLKDEPWDFCPEELALNDEMEDKL